MNIKGDTYISGVIPPKLDICSSMGRNGQEQNKMVVQFLFSMFMDRCDLESVRWWRLSTIRTVIQLDYSGRFGNEQSQWQSPIINFFYQFKMSTFQMAEKRGGEQDIFDVYMVF